MNEPVREGGGRIFRTLFERGCTAQLIVDPDDGTILDANPAACSLYGRDLSTLLTMRLGDLSSTDAVDSFLKRAQASGESCFADRHEDQKGRSRTVEICASAVEVDERPLLFLNVRDVTAERRLRDELVRQDKLESLGVLAGGIAHDFNNQLTTILGNLSLLRVRIEEPGALDPEPLLDAVENAAKRTAELTRRLLVFSRGGSTVRKPISCRRIIDESVHHALKGSKVQLEVEADDEPGTVSADPAQLGQVFGNLALNSRQAMPDGGKIRIDVGRVELGAGHAVPLDAGTYVRIRIRDDGEGIRSDHLSRIFDPFFTTRMLGRGLGLAACFRIIKVHDGHIQVESERGVGTTVTIWLPAVDAPEKAGGDPVSRTIPGFGRILVMDDDPAVRAVTLAMLRSLGYEPEGAADGEEAVEAYRAALGTDRPFLAVILDLTVPGGMGGKEAAEAIIDLDAEARLIASSGYSDDVVLADHRDFGFRSALPKPFRMGALSRSLAAVLSSTIS